MWQVVRPGAGMWAPEVLRRPNTSARPRSDVLSSNIQVQQHASRQLLGARAALLPLSLCSRREPAPVIVEWCIWQPSSPVLCCAAYCGVFGGALLLAPQDQRFAAAACFGAASQFKSNMQQMRAAVYVVCNQHQLRVLPKPNKLNQSASPQAGARGSSPLLNSISLERPAPGAFGQLPPPKSDWMFAALPCTQSMGPKQGKARCMKAKLLRAGRRRRMKRLFRKAIYICGAGPARGAARARAFFGRQQAARGEGLMKLGLSRSATSGPWYPVRTLPRNASLRDNVGRYDTVSHSLVPTTKYTKEKPPAPLAGTR